MQVCVLLIIFLITALQINVCFFRKFINYMLKKGQKKLARQVLENVCNQYNY